MPSIDRNSPTPFYQQVYEQISAGIESGLYPAGKKLPSIRECARELGVSNTTIELAYQRLTEEGYVQSRRGSGYTICGVTPAPSNRLERFDEQYWLERERLLADEASHSDAAQPAFDFAYDSVDPSLFPFTPWARICREVFFRQGAEQSCLYNDRQGLKELREQIAHYLNSEYGLACLAEQVLVMPTTRDLVSEIASLFDPDETLIGIEEPGYNEVRRRLHQRGYRLRPIPVHPYPTLDDALRPLQGVKLVFTTPASQFPSNRAMPDDLRTALVRWAQDNDTYVIDDEYGWEFQSGIARTPPLATIDGTGRVITLGTFSNSFTPAICLSYAVLPPALMLRWRHQARNSHPQAPWQTQAAMALFMSEGHWRTHIRKIRTSMQSKRAQLVSALRAHLGNSIEIVEGPSSLFVLVQACNGCSEQQLIEAAAEMGVRVYPTSQYWQDDPPDNWRYVLIGYAGIPAERIDEGIQLLADSWKRLDLEGC